jgi:hypothetical protein
VCDAAPFGEFDALGLGGWVLAGMLIQALVFVGVGVAANQTVALPYLHMVRRNSEQCSDLVLSAAMRIDTVRMPVKRPSCRAKSGDALGQSRERPKMFQAGLYPSCVRQQSTDSSDAESRDAGVCSSLPPDHRRARRWNWHANFNLYCCSYLSFVSENLSFNNWLARLPSSLPCPNTARSNGYAATR